MRTAVSSVAILLTALLVSCGGGGGDSGGSPPPAAPAISYGPSGSPATQFTFTAQTQVSLTPNNTGGAAASWAVTPALPGGLSFDASTGAITGKPSAFAPTSVTVTATNPGGSSSVTLMLRTDAVVLNLGATCLVDLSGGSQQGVLAIDSTNVLTIDCFGQQHWVLWNYATGALVAQGDPCPLDACAGTIPGGLAPLFGLAGSIAAVPHVAPGTSAPEGFQIISTADGTVRATITPDEGVDWLQVATDGSYICGAVGSGGDLTVWAPDGSVLTTVTGNYRTAKAYCAPGQVQVALGPKGSSVIETITVSGGASSVSPGFAGTFNAWFSDGSAFLTNVGTQVWVYSPAAVQLDHVTSLPTVNKLAGWGPWFWSFDGLDLNIYKVGSSATATATYSGATDVKPSGSTIGLLGAALRIIDLAGAAPSETDHAPPFSDVYAAVSASQWVVGSGAWGAVLDGPSLATTPRYFGYGRVRGLAGSPTRFAVGTSIGTTLIFNTNDLSLETTLNLSVFSNQLCMSADGTVLAVLTQQPDSLTVQTLSLPTGTVLNTWTYPSGGPTPAGITLSSSGALLGQVLVMNTGFTRQVTSSAGGAVLWSDAGTAVPAGPVLISLDDMLIAVSDSVNTDNSNIYLNGALSTAIPAVAIGWLQGNNLVANVSPTAAAIFNSAGVKQNGPPLPYLRGPIQVLSATSIYDQGFNAIYSLSTGEQTWTPPAGASGVRGTAAGPLLVFPTLSNQLLAEPY